MAEPLTAGDPTRIGPYTVEGRLGAGGMGAVYLGRGRDGVPAAIKVVHPGLAGQREFRARFGREVAAARRVRGPHLARLRDADPDAPLAWLATDYVDGPSLDHAVQTRGPLPEHDVHVLARELFGALAAVHAAGIVHRDVKPTNVLLGPSGGVLIDFGIAQAAESTRITRTGMVIGSPGFMSPEQAAGHEIGPASDVFSLAAVLLFAATGAGPFGVGSPAALLLRAADVAPDTDALPNGLRPLLEPCLSRDPAARPTAAVLAGDPAARDRAACDPADERARTGQDRPVATVPPTGPSTGPRWHPEWEGVPVERHRSRRWWWLVASGATAAVAAVLTTVVLLSSTPAPAPPAGPPAPATLSTASLTAPDDVTDVAFSPDGSRAYVAHHLGVDVVDTATTTVTTSVRTRSGTTAVAVGPDGDRLYVAMLDRSVQILDATTLRAVGEVEIPAYTSRLMAARDGRRVFALMQPQGGVGEIDVPTQVGVLDPAAGPAATVVPTGVAGPGQMELSGDGSTLFVAGKGAVVGFGTTDLTVRSQTVTGQYPQIATAPGDGAYLSEVEAPFVRRLASDGGVVTLRVVGFGPETDFVTTMAGAASSGRLTLQRDRSVEVVDVADARVTAVGGSVEAGAGSALRASPDGTQVYSFKSMFSPTVNILRPPT